ncbi:hypothetical protein LINGRAPRIM_LOCUS2483 [Linum grandiflorum]
MVRRIFLIGSNSRSILGLRFFPIISRESCISGSKIFGRVLVLWMTIPLTSTPFWLVLISTSPLFSWFLDMLADCASNYRMF